MRIAEGIFLDFDDVLLRPKRSSLAKRSDVSLVRDFKSRWHRGKILRGTPLIAANMYHTGTPEMAAALEKHNCFVAFDKAYDNDTLVQNTNWNTWFSIGESKAELVKLDNFLAKLYASTFNNKPLVNIEVANAHRQKFVDTIKEAREKHPEIVIMCGDVASPSMVEELILAGADIVRVGIGPGSQCQTRIVTGVGVPQFSLLVECADAAHGLDGLICSDGGCKTSGDLVKAFAAGTDFIMLGGMFAGHDECRGDNRVDEATGEITHMKFFGSASQAALDMRGINNDYRPYEGKTSWIEYKGPIDGTMKQLLGGIKSACTYIGASGIKQIHKRAEIIRKR